MTLSNSPVTAPGLQWSANGAYDPTTGEIYVGVVAGGPKHISGQVGNSTVVAGNFLRISLLDPQSFVIAPYNQTGNPAWNFTAMTPQFPPTSDTQYRPGTKE